MAKRGNRNNALAGAFLVGGLILTAAVAFWLGEATDRLGGRTRYVVEFGLDEPLPTLSEGSAVTLAGQPVGFVSKISRVGRETPDGKLFPEKVEVIVSIRDSIALHEGTTAEMRAPLLGGVGTLDIVDLGNPSAPELPEMGRIDGLGAGGIAVDMLAQLGVTKADIARYEARVDAILANAEAGSADFAEIAAIFAGDAQPTARSVRASAEHVEDLLARVGAGGAWRTTIETTLANIERASAEAPRLMTDARGFVGELDTALTDYRPSFDEIVENARATMAYVERTTDERVTPLLDEWTSAGAQANQTGATFEKLGTDVGLLVDRESKQISRILTEVRLTSSQANLFLQELRAAPWRVLAPPKQRDLAREPLYAAARAYADSVADLRAVTESLDAALSANRTADGSPATRGAIDPQELARMHDALRARYRDFEDAERRLLEVLGTQQDEQP